MFARASHKTNSPQGSVNHSVQKKHLSPLLFPWSVFSERGNEDKSFLVKGEASVSVANPQRKILALVSTLFLLCFHSCFFHRSPSAFIMLIQRMLSTLQVYCEPSYSCRERARGCPLFCSPENRAFIMDVYVVDKIPSTYVLISIRKPERCAAKATTARRWFRQ